MANQCSDKRYPFADACMKYHCLHCMSQRPCPPLIVIAMQAASAIDGQPCQRSTPRRLNLQQREEQLGLLP
jgi:hypothetical protein